MNPHALRAAEIEAAFLAGAEANLNQAREQRFRGTKWLWAGRSQEDRVRELMAARQRYDRELLRSLPKNAARIMTCIEPSWLLWEKPVTIVIAATLSPLEFYVEESTPGGEDEGGAADGRVPSPPPIGSAELTAYVKQLIGDSTLPHVIGVCSPTGFTEEAKRLGVDGPNLTLVLVEPRTDGGWTTLCASPGARPADARLFDPEAAARKTERIREEVSARRADLLTGGLSASSIASRLGVPATMVGRVFEQMTMSDGELRVSWQGNDVLLYLGAPAGMEASEMSMVEWIRTLFSGEGEEARKINALTERRAKLASRRDRLYDDVGKLESREADLMKQGRESASPAVRRRVATQVKQLRDDMERMHAAARMVGQQIDVISTHVHSLTLIQQGQAAKLPTPEELTQDAVRAEELLEQLGAEVELASSLAPTGREAGLTNEELEILRELEAPSKQGEKVKPARRAERTPEETPPSRVEPPRETGEPQAG
jgi:hypothetical protein